MVWRGFAVPPVLLPPQTPSQGRAPWWWICQDQGSSLCWSTGVRRELILWWEVAINPQGDENPPELACRCCRRRQIKESNRPASVNRPSEQQVRPQCYFDLSQGGQTYKKVKTSSNSGPCQGKMSSFVLAWAGVVLAQYRHFPLFGQHSSVIPLTVGDYSHLKKCFSAQSQNGLGWKGPEK